MDQRQIEQRRHNLAGARIAVEVRLFNSLSNHSKGRGRRLEVSAGTTVGDVLRDLALAPGDVHLAMVNGRDITPALNAPVRTDYYLQDGDVLALSGPVPYSYGYGAPVV